MDTQTAISWSKSHIERHDVIRFHREGLSNYRQSSLHWFITPTLPTFLWTSYPVSPPTTNYRGLQTEVTKMRMLKPYGLSHLVALVLLSLQAHAALYPLELGNLETAHDDNPAQLTAEETEQLNEYEFEDEICTTFHDIEPLISLASCVWRYHPIFFFAFSLDIV